MEPRRAWLRRISSLDDVDAGSLGALRRVFDWYCAHVGGVAKPSADTLSMFQFTRLLTDAGVLGRGLSRDRSDVLYTEACRRRPMRWAEFMRAVGLAAAALYPARGDAVAMLLPAFTQLEPRAASASALYAAMLRDRALPGLWGARAGDARMLYWAALNPAFDVRGMTRLNEDEWRTVADSGARVGCGEFTTFCEALGVAPGLLRGPKPLRYFHAAAAAAAATSDGGGDGGGGGGAGLDFAGFQRALSLIAFDAFRGDIALAPAGKVRSQRACAGWCASYGAAQ